MYTNNNNTVLTVQRLTKSFLSHSGERIVALSDMSLTAAFGEFVVLIGPTGCGKTTLLNIIAGLDVPDQGQVYFHAAHQQKSRIAYVFQHYTLFPWRTLRENVAFGPQMRGSRRKDRIERAQALLEQVGLHGFEKAYPHETSGGMRQRAAIAQALAIRPEILLMDEPFGSLDDFTRKDLQQLLVSLSHQEAMTILFVTHNIEEAVILGDRILAFSPRPGRIEEEIRVPLDQPRNPQNDAFVDCYLKVYRAVHTQTLQHTKTHKHQSIDD